MALWTTAPPFRRPARTRRPADGTTPNGAVEDVAETVTGNVTYYAQYEVQPHVWTEDWDSDDTYHWHTCTVDGCGYTKDKAEHDYTDADDTICDTCG